MFVLLTTAAWAAVCFFKVHQASDPSGGDGYFYLKQIEWLVEHQQFYHADYSFVFFPLAILYGLTGSSLLAFQIVTSLSLFLISSAVGLLFYKSLEQMKQPWSQWRRVLLSCIFVLVFAMQGSVLKLSYEFAKSGFAQALIMIGVYLSVHGNRRVAFGFMLLAALTHKIAAVFFVFVILICFIDWFCQNKQLSSKKIVGVFGLISLSAAFLMSSRFIQHFQNFISHLSYEKFLLGQLENQLLGRFLIALTVLWLITASIQFFKSKNPILLSMLLFSFVPFLPVFGGYNIEIKYRLLLIGFTFAATCFALVWPNIKNDYLKRLVMMITLTILSFQAFQYTGFPWIMNWSEKIKNLDQLQERVDPKDELVTQHGLQFYIDYKTKIRARSMVSSQRKPVYQIAYTPEFYHLNPTLSDEIHQIEIISLGDSYALFEYDEFQELTKEFPMLADWRNQFQVRPEFVQDY